MSITDELRRFANEWDWLDYKADESARRLRAIADHIDAEHEAMLADARKAVYQDYVELPKDADGEYICAGDKLDGYGKTIEVVELRYGRSGWVLISRDGNAYADTFAFTHHHAPTVEDVLEELLREYDRDDSELTNGEIVEMFAKRLTLVGDSE